MPNIIGNTKDLTEEEWLNWRAHGKDWADPASPNYIPVTVGGSLVSSIFNCSPWSNALKAYNEKLGIEPAVKGELNVASKKAGHLFEPYVAEMFKQWCINHGYTCELVSDTNMYQHSKYSFALANLDFITVVNGKKGILECKTTNRDYAGLWKQGEVPFYYELQCRFYLEVMDLDFCYIVCCWGFKEDEMAVIRIDRDRTIGQTIMEKCAEFVECVKNQTPPSVDGASKENLLQFYVTLYGENKEAEPVQLPLSLREQVDELLEIDKQLKEVAEQEKSLKKRRIELAADFIEEMQDNSTGIYQIGDDTIEVSMHVAHFQSTFDIEAFKRDEPELYKKLHKDTIDVAKLKEIDEVLKNKYTIPGEINPKEAKKTYVSAKVIKPKKK